MSAVGHDLLDGAHPLCLDLFELAQFVGAVGDLDGKVAVQAHQRTSKARCWRRRATADRPTLERLLLPRLDAIAAASWTT